MVRDSSITRKHEDSLSPSWQTSYEIQSTAIILGILKYYIFAIDVKFAIIKILYRRSNSQMRLSLSTIIFPLSLFNFDFVSSRSLKKHGINISLKKFPSIPLDAPYKLTSANPKFNTRGPTDQDCEQYDNGGSACGDGKSQSPTLNLIIGCCPDGAFCCGTLPGPIGCASEGWPPSTCCETTATQCPEPSQCCENDTRCCS